jgi:hypothetical protein
MMPPLIQKAGPWAVLPPGVHSASIQEIRATFGQGAKRAILLAGLIRGCHDLMKAGCKNILVDGSFVTGKPIPGDFDACWLPAPSMNYDLLNPAFFDFSNDRAMQKNLYGGEFWPSTLIEAASGMLFIDFFQNDRHTGERKGIVEIDLTTLSKNGNVL